MTREGKETGVRVGLKKSHHGMVGRELDMIELKREINGLLENSGQPKKYTVL